MGLSYTINMAYKNPGNKGAGQVFGKRYLGTKKGTRNEYMSLFLRN